ncbi:uncharacterized protein [Henckelia pumila]|uniref:uncharacterized protein n=1 Tax=Henckelia pumila TaxID=405737 RepID=UPI003C6DF0C5
MAANSQQFGTNRRNGQNVKKCGICAAMGHETDMCPTLQEESTEQVDAAGGFSGPPQQNLHLTYNRMLKLTGHHIIHNSSVLKFQRLETRASIQQLNTQMRQLETAVNRLEALNSNSLPSQTVVNPKDNVSAITLRSGKELKIREEAVQEPIKGEDNKESKVEENEKIQEAPRALKESRKDKGIKGLYEVFRRCERKHKLKGCHKVELGENVSAVIQRKVPTKCKDPVADRSTIYPRGLLEDVLVQVGNLVFPADFYVLDMKNNDLDSPILLERSFLKTLKSIIDVNNGTLTMEFDGEIVKFHIFDTLQIPDCESVVNNLDAINHLSQEHKEVVNEGKLKEVIAQLAKNSIAEIFISDLKMADYDESHDSEGGGRWGDPNDRIRCRGQLEERKRVSMRRFKEVNPKPLTGGETPDEAED